MRLAYIAGPYNVFMNSQILLTPIGIVRSAVGDPADDIWGGVTATIELDRHRFTPESLAGLDEFSHVEVIFVLDRIPDDTIEFGARHPRNRPDWPKVGIFAQRSKNRPNRIAVTVCRLVAVDGLSIKVEGLDAIDRTPVIDIKPYIREIGPRGPVRQPAWTTRLMANYWNVGA